MSHSISVEDELNSIANAIKTIIERLPEGHNDLENLPYYNKSLENQKYYEDQKKLQNHKKSENILKSNGQESERPKISSIRSSSSSSYTSHSVNDDIEPANKKSDGPSNMMLLMILLIVCVLCLYWLGKYLRKPW